MIHRLHNPVRRYDWGSHTHIARLTGRNLGSQPAAEMWIGAHPSAPSRLSVAGGADVRQRLGDRMPFLMKLLAANEPLSLQVHPAREQARKRFDEQEAAGIARDARERSYPDASHKPELLYALTRLEGMAGFRHLPASAAILRGLDLGWLDAAAHELEHAQNHEVALRSLVTSWLALAPSDVRGRLREVRAAAELAEARVHQAARPHRPTPVDAADVSRESARVYAATVPLVDRYPDDPGVLVTLLLNHLVLAPGESMFVDAGIVHAYTSGFGVEIMASSDNVIRAGLTSKHVDIPELLEVATFAPIPPPRWPARAEGAVLRLAPPVDEFELCVIELDDGPVRFKHSAPRMALCLGGTARLSCAAGSLILERGEAAFAGAAGGALAVSGRGRLALGQTPEVGADAAA
jgi:mannose-6-phosphate isomerase